MKLSLIAACSLSLLVACGNDDSNKLNRSTPSAAQPPEETPAAARPLRTMVDGNAHPTSAVNLLADPGFGLTGQQAGFGSFIAFDDTTFAQLALSTSVDSRSPAGFGGAVGIIKPDGATDKRSTPITLLTSFQGGAGPFHARVWVSKLSLAGRAVALTIDEKGVVASVTDETPDGEAFELAVVPGAVRVAGGRTWTLLSAEITKPLTYGGFFVLHTGTGGGQFLIAAPEVVAQPLVDGLASTRSASPNLHARARAKTATERGAILRYKSKPPQLVPAR